MESQKTVISALYILRYLWTICLIDKQKLEKHLLFENQYGIPKIKKLALRDRTSYNTLRDA